MWKQCFWIHCCLQESNAFAPAFQHCGKAGGQGGLRIIHYPPVEGEIKDKVDHQQQTRLGAHTDLGGVSFLFQDDAGGLQVNTLFHVQLDY